MYAVAKCYERALFSSNSEVLAIPTSNSTFPATYSSIIWTTVSIEVTRSISRSTAKIAKIASGNGNNTLVTGDYDIKGDIVAKLDEKAFPSLKNFFEGLRTCIVGNDGTLRAIEIM